MRSATTRIARWVPTAIADLTHLPKEAVWVVLVDPPDRFVSGKLVEVKKYRCHAGDGRPPSSRLRGATHRHNG